MTQLRVLVVDDDIMVATVLSGVLEDMGYAVCGIEMTEAGAVSAAELCKPDVMVIDVLLDDGSGISAVDQILRHRFVPHVFVSGDVTLARARRPDAIVLQKPFREDELARALQHVLSTEPATFWHGYHPPAAPGARA